MATKPCPTCGEKLFLIPSNQIEPKYIHDITGKVKCTNLIFYTKDLLEIKNNAWREGYRQGVTDERMSQDFTNGDVSPNRTSPYGDK